MRRFGLLYVYALGRRLTPDQCSLQERRCVALGADSDANVFAARAGIEEHATPGSLISPYPRARVVCVFA